MLLAAVARLTAADAPRPAWYIALAGTAVLAVGLVLRRGTLTTAGLVLVGTGYGLSLVGKAFDPASSLVAGGLLMVAELAYWALEPGASVRVGREATARRALFSGTLALGAVLAGALLLGVAAAPTGSGAAVEIAGVVAVAVVLAVVVGLMHALRPRGPVR